MRPKRFSQPLMFILWLSVIAATGHAREQALDPAAVMGPTACGDCHESSLNAWRGSHHFSTYKEMPRSKEAREIADKMGIKRIKTEGDCASCHFTSQTEDTKTAAIAGITCESCHAAGKDYIEVHSDFGGEDVTAENETPAHKKERWAKSEAAGMIRPNNLYALAENCYQCHTVPNESLVNTGGHAAGSLFELVAWTQGEVRHNVWYNDGEGNPAASAERQRLMYVVGQALDLEYALRGVAKATSKDTYAVEMAKRAKRAALGIKAIVDTGIDLPETNALLAIAGGTKVSLNNEAALLAAAEKVSEQAQAIANRYDGSELGKIDGLLPSPADYVGNVNQP